MNCYQKNCPWRHNSYTNIYECDCAYTCPNRAEKPITIIISDHTDYCDKGGIVSDRSSNSTEYH